jgi:CCR4-NOT transcription complex subunit 1
LCASFNLLTVLLYILFSQWGLLITFIELIKNPKYNFWRKAFVRSAPEMERVFESIARSCLGAAYSAVQQQQQAAAAQP